MIKITIAIIFTVLMTRNVAAQRVVTLEEIIDLAAQYNFGLRIAANDRKAAENSAI